MAQAPVSVSMNKAQAGINEKVQYNVLKSRYLTSLLPRRPGLERARSFNLLI